MNIKDIKAQIIKGVHLDNLTEAEQAEIVLGLAKLVASRVSLSLWETLSDEEKKGLEDNTITEYVATKLEDFPNLVEEVISKTVLDFNREMGI